MVDKSRSDSVVCLAEDADTLLNWATEVGLEGRGPEMHPGRPFGRLPPITSADQSHSEPVTMLTTYSFTLEPRAAAYGELLEFALQLRDVPSLAVRPSLDLSDRGKTFIDALRPYLVRRAHKMR